MLASVLVDDPQNEATKLQEVAQSIAGDEDTHSVAWAIDPATWQGAIFRLSATRPENFPNSTAYQVTHLSRPEIDQLD